MFENEAKGWYGSYSRVGKGYAERFYIISHKDEIFSRENKKIRIKDFFNPDEIKQKSSLEETLDVFKVYTSNKKKKEKILKGLLKPKKTFLDYRLQYKKLLKKRKLKYNDIHKILYSKNMPKIHHPPCTRYNPNYNFIKPRLLEGPLWKDVLGRTQRGLNPYEDKILREQIKDNQNYKYYILEGEKSKCLVNMNKTTQRGEFSDIKDLRIRTDKPFKKPKKRNKTIENKTQYKLKNNIFNNINNIRNLKVRNKSIRIVSKYNNTTTTFYTPRELLQNEIDNISNKKNENKNKNKRKKINKIMLKEIGLYENENSNNNNINRNTINNIIDNKMNKKLINIKSSTPLQKDIYKYNIKINSDYKSLTERNEKREQSTENSHRIIKKLKAPDFKKIISREQVEKAFGIKYYKIPFITPNYTLVTERSLSMIDYDRNKYHSIKTDNNYQPLDYSFSFKPDELIDKYNNHISPKVPNFNCMTSRPNKKNCPLPSYMQNVHDRSSLCNLNDKSLFLNNYSNRGYSPAATTFFPKKSFNNIINYSVINGKKNIENKKDEDLQKKFNLLKLQINYEPEVCEQLIKEGTINKFDKITLKTNTKKNEEDSISVKKKKEFYI